MNSPPSLPSMRIIAGSAKGRRLKVPDQITRPSSERLREALFNVLRELIDQARVLDLFAGSGALGIEALSRGAQHADFVEQDRDACRIIRANLQATGFTSTTNRKGTHTVSQMSVERYLAQAHTRGTYDLILADPPYTSTSQRLGLGPLAANLLQDSHLPTALTPGGLFVLETERSEALPQAPSALELLDIRKYGKSSVHYYRRHDPSSKP